MTITLPIVEKLSLNKIYGGIHHTTRTKHKNLYHEVVWASQVPKYEGTFPVQITYHFKFKGRKLDSSNCAYMVKLLEDGLVKEGVIPDDSPVYVRKTSEVTDTGDNEVTITIEPV